MVRRNFTIGTLFIIVNFTLVLRSFAEALSPRPTASLGRVSSLQARASTKRLGPFQRHSNISAICLQR